MRARRRLGLLLLGAALAACGSEEGAQVAQGQDNVVRGTVSKGPLQGATVNFFAVDVAGNPTGGALVSPVTTDATGAFRVSGLPLNVPILVQTSGGNYLDESDPETDPALRRRITFGPTEQLRAVLPATAAAPAGGRTMAITPYSMALYKKAFVQAAGSNFANVYDAVHVQAQSAFGFDPILTIPADPITGAGGSPEYALLLGAAALTINKIALTGTPEHIPAYADVIAFVDDFADGRLDAANLDEMIRRFRNNNIGVYSGIDTPFVDEAALSLPANVPNTGGTRFLPFRDASGNLKVIDPRVGLASITQVATGVPEHNDANPGNYQTLFAADVDGGTDQATNIRHARAAFIRAGQVFVVNLDTGAAPTPVATSITDACGFFGTGEDIAAPDNSTLFIKTSGGDACGNANDLPRALLGLSPSAIVVDAPNLQEVRGLHSATGALIGHLALFGTSQSDGTSVKRCDTSFNCATTVATLAAGGGNFNFMREKGFSLFYLAFRDTDDPGTRLYRYDAGSGVLSAPLHDFTGNTHDGTSDASHFYFPNGNALYRVGHLDTTSQLLVTMPAGDQIEDMELTASRAVFEARNASGFTNVYSVVKGGGPSTPLLARALSANESARLAYADAGGRVFLDASVDSGGTRTAESSAQVLADGSGFTELADSTYAGGTRVTSFNLEAMDDLPALRLLRARHAPTGPGSSDDTLETIDPATGTVVSSPGVLSAVIRFDGVNGDGVGRYMAIETASAGDGLHNVHLIDTQAVGITNVSSSAGEENWVFFENDGQQPPGNGPPSAANDGYAATEDTPLTTSAPGVLGNDFDPESNPLTAVLDSQPPAGQGSVTLNANGSFTFTPAPNFFGTTSFTYHANDGQANSNVATVTINVFPVNNDPPVASNDSYTASVNTTLNVGAPGVLGNDIDPDGTTPTANAASGSTAQLGTYTLNADGSFTYTPPNSTFTGPDSFPYTAFDGANSSSAATVNITVTANTPPTISDITDQTITEDASTGALAFTVGDAETPAASLTVSGTSSNLTLVPNANIAFGGTGASRTVTVTPAANQSGTATITVTVTDSASGTASDTFLLTVNAAPDAPVANNDAYSTPVNTTLNIAAPGVLANDTDPDGPAPMATAGSGGTPAGGSFTVIADGSFTYTPPAAFAGTDSFTYTATDGALTASATVSITVTGGPAFTYLPYFVDTAQNGGEFAVKSTDFTPPPITVVPTGSATPTSIDRVASTGVVLNADNSINTIFQDRLVFIEGGQLWYSGLRDSDAPATLTRFSSETAANVSCGVNLEELDFDSSRDAWFFYRLPGLDGSCFTADDVTKAAKLSFGTAGGAGSDPITLPPGSNEFPTRFFAPSDLRTLGFLVMDAGKLDFYDPNLQLAGNFVPGGVTSVSRLRGDFNKALVVINNTDGRIVSVSDATTPVPAITAVVYTVQGGFSSNCGANEDATHYYVCEGRFTPSPAGRITSVPKNAIDASGNLIVHDNTINSVFLQGLTDNRVVWQSANELVMLNKSGPPNLQTLTTSVAPGPVMVGATRVFFTESVAGPSYSAVGADESNARIFSGGTASAWVGLGAQIVGQTTSGFVTDRAVRGLLVQGFSNFDTTGVFGSTLRSVDLTEPTVSVPAASVTTFSGSTTDNRDLFIFLNAPTFTGLGALCEKSPGTDCDIVAIDASATPRYQRVTATPATSENPTSE